MLTLEELALRILSEGETGHAEPEPGAQISSGRNLSSRSISHISKGNLLREPFEPPE